MAEYIDREVAKKMLDEYRISRTMSMYGDIDLLTEWREGVKCSMKKLDEVPTADVVPKSEVDLYRKQVDELEDELASTYDKLEKLEHILDCYALQYGTVTNQREVIEKAKAEIAREIFEEIEKHLVFNAYGIAVISDKTFEEIKNKYMGVKNDR